MLRNHLGLELFRNSACLPTPRSGIVHLRLNDRNDGVMWRVERIDGDFLRARDMSRHGSIYESDPASPVFSYRAVPLTPLPDMIWYRNTYDHKKGSIDYDDLVDLIEHTLQLEPTPFPAAVEQVVRVDDYLVYLAAMAAIQNHDHVRKDFYLYRQSQAGQRRRVPRPGG